MRTHLFILATFLLFAGSMFVVHAQTDYIPLAPLPNTVLLPNNTPDPQCNPLDENALKPGTDAYKEKCKLSSANALPRYLTGIYKTGIAAAGILAVLMLVWGGFQYMTTEAIQGKSESRGVIMNVVWGLATVLASYVLLYTINPRLVDIGLALENLRPVTKTRIPTAQDTYGKILDDLLKSVNEGKAKLKEVQAPLKVTAQTIQQQLDTLDPQDPQFAQKKQKLEADLTKTTNTITALATVEAGREIIQKNTAIIIQKYKDAKTQPEGLKIIETEASTLIDDIKDKMQKLAQKGFTQQVAELQGLLRQALKDIGKVSGLNL
ncbi:MAG: hypothetical protein G01um101417_200 [Parcubacteria group bacterium Gr01-1014_17]|nr:MAG: hypothetical protein G01um101417_200 [Parcubacteria group bacterium Gr01-1014_17]